MLALHGATSWAAVFGQFIVPVLIGNIVGGMVLFGLIAYAQVMKEI
jgi:formate-nitrite transporter family protein